MTSALYPKFKQFLLSQNPSIDLDTDTIKVTLVNLATDYTYNSAHDYLDDVTRSWSTFDETLSAKTVTDGVFNNTSDTTFSAVTASGSKTVGALVIYKDNNGTASSSPLIAYIDGFTPITPNGGDITVTWDSGANKIFKL